ncbi:heterokaryon incompatibility protein-domain-containing protein [Ampelomyces quisqualis]|uniref:Heterokaryon incompatibility protein-domain-containing protein n=1 Tax=Ampelomyces quisqualis TaxID=50730 RepID=A0A6A5R0N1_AMPQU|nr:heterokaryon incompatibility protein-domain-containing protein [Ampelomyces quisqualis]
MRGKLPRYAKRHKKPNQGNRTDNLVGSGHTPQSKPFLDEELPFRHTPLDLKSNSIRLLKLLPGRDEYNRIRCELRHATIADDYTCLSYEWGTQKNMGLITINGHPYHVGENLLHFLSLASSDTAQQNNLGMPTKLINEDRSRQVLDLGSSVRSLWIDAICIDQSNFDERNHQVAQMGFIFRRARQVFTWLGNDSKHSGKWFPRIRQHQLINICTGRVSNEEELESCRTRIGNNTYWKRAWIIQEIMLAKYIFIIWGKDAVDVIDVREQLCHAIMSTEDLSSRSWQDLLISREKYLEEDSGWSREVLLAEGTLLRNLAMFREHKCGVPRDRIFALLSISTDANKFQIDYLKPIWDLAIAVMKNSGPLFCLCHAVLVLTTLRLHCTCSNRYFKSFQATSFTLGACSCELCGSQLKPLDKYLSGETDECMETYICCLGCTHEPQPGIRDEFAPKYGHVIIAKSQLESRPGDPQVWYMPDSNFPETTVAEDYGKQAQLSKWIINQHFRLDRQNLSRIHVTLHGLREMAGLRSSLAETDQAMKKTLNDVCHGQGRVDRPISSGHGWI